MKPKANNATYCRKYREKNIENIRKKDKERKKFARDYLKYVENDKYEERKRKDRERKRLAKERKEAEAIEVDHLDVSTGSNSSFKHKSTKYRSLKKADDALPNSPHKRREIVSNLAKKYEIRINLNSAKVGRKATVLTSEEEKWIEDALDRPEISYMNPGKNDHFTKKIDGKKIYIQKRYLLYPLRDVLEILNGSEISSGEGFRSKFDKPLTFSLFYKFIKLRKQYIFNGKIPQYTCLCEVCENAVLLAKGLNQSSKTKSIPSDPHAIVEEYSCSSDNKSCMMSLCDKCKIHGLVYEDFVASNESSSDSNETDSDSESEGDHSCNYYIWKKGADGYLTKMNIKTDIEEALVLWQTTVEVIKKHIHTKRRQFAEISRITNNLANDEILIHLDYSENYKCKQQNEIQSAYFGNKGFSLFTACAYYRENEQTNKLPITITTEEKDKSRVASMSCVNMVINHCRQKIKTKISTVHIVSDGCSSQFRSRFVFNLLIHFQKDLNLEWHYNEAHHGKGPMDGIGGTIKNLVHRKVMSGAIIINSPEEFASYADKISNVDCLYLQKNDLLTEPEEVAKALKIPKTLQLHKVKRVRQGNTFINQFFFLSEDAEPYFTRKYGVHCGHAMLDDTDVNICKLQQCQGTFIEGEEWLECPLCSQWFHENCFYV